MHLPDFRQLNTECRKRARSYTFRHKFHTEGVGTWTIGCGQKTSASCATGAGPVWRRRDPRWWCAGDPASLRRHSASPSAARRRLHCRLSQPLHHSQTPPILPRPSGVDATSTDQVGRVHGRVCSRQQVIGHAIPIHVASYPLEPCCDCHDAQIPPSLPRPNGVDATSMSTKWVDCWSSVQSTRGSFFT